MKKNVNIIGGSRRFSSVLGIVFPPIKKELTDNEIAVLKNEGFKIEIEDTKKRVETIKPNPTPIEEPIHEPIKEVVKTEELVEEKTEEIEKVEEKIEVIKPNPVKGNVPNKHGFNKR